MKILSEKEYQEAMHEMNAVISKGDQNISHEERMRYEELLDATLQWELENSEEDYRKDMEAGEKKYIRKGEVLHRHKHSKEYLRKFKKKQ